MFFNLIIFIILFTSQAFADVTSSLSMYSITSPTSITLDSANNSGIDSYTKLLLNLNNNITDSSQSNLTLTNNNVTFSNSSPVFSGTYYGVFNGSNAYLTTPANSVLNVGSSNFTIDVWAQLSSTSGTYERLFGQNDSSGSNGSTSYYILYYGTGVTASPYYQATVCASSTCYSIISGTMTDTNWHHHALVRNGNTLTYYIDGTSVGTSNVTGVSVNASSYHLSIGRQGEYASSPGNYWPGNIQEFRISNGIARWTSNFTPPSLPYGTPPVSQITLEAGGTQEAKVWMDGNDSDKFKIDDSTATRLTISGGNVGIGTTSPSLSLDVAGPVRVQTGFVTSGTAPTIGTGTGDCGTSPSVTGNDISGTITVGSGTNGGKCTVTFSAAKSSTPNCICQDSTTSSLTRAGNQSTTSFQCIGALTAGDNLVYWCPQ